MDTTAARWISFSLVVAGFALAGCSSDSGAGNPACATCDGNGSDNGNGNENGADGGTTSGGHVVDASADGAATASCAGSAPSGVSVSPTTLAFGTATLGEATTTSLVTVMNASGSAFPIGSVAISGANAADFAEQTDCPASLAAGEKCYVRVVFTPSAVGARAATVAVGGACTSAISGTGVSLANGFYVSPKGNDSNDGSLASPFLTLTKAQTAMRASGGAKLTTYVRAGAYSPANIASCGCALDLNNNDNGQTWSYYPPDGVDSAIIDGGSTHAGSGIVTLISVAGSTNVTIDGLTLRNFDFAGVGGVNSTKITAKNNIIYNGFQTAQYGAQGVTCGQTCTSWSVLNNVMHDITGGGANIVSAQAGDVSNLIYSGNFVYNTCTSPDDGGDCGALYTQDNTAKSTNITITGNFVRDGNRWRGQNAGSAILSRRLFVERNSERQRHHRNQRRQHHVHSRRRERRLRRQPHRSRHVRPAHLGLANVRQQKLQRDDRQQIHGQRRRFEERRQLHRSFISANQNAHGLEQHLFQLRRQRDQREPRNRRRRQRSEAVGLLRGRSVEPGLRDRIFAAASQLGTARLRNAERRDHPAVVSVADVPLSCD